MASDHPTELDPSVLRPSGALLATQIALGAAIERHAVAPSEHDATTLDLLVRLDIGPEDGLRAAELCRQLKLSPSHISRMVDRAEAAGLVERRPDPVDRRAKVVVLTAAGRREVGRFAPRLHAVLDRVIHRVLSTEEIDRLVGYLERIEAAADTFPGPDGPDGPGAQTT
ncbi:MAG: MarR family transcriptional regulator [Actinomycetota bacterium]